MLNKLKSSLEILRQTKPLVLNLTNYVTMDFVANCLLSVGAAPIMSEDIKEIEELIQISSAVHVNIGTLTAEFIERAVFACKIAKKYNKPIVLDPVGVGASYIRMEAAKELLVFADILRGNASEVMAVYGLASKELGVESAHQVTDALEAARGLALEYKITVIVSGVEDFITDGTREQILKFGSNLMPLITGTGCSLTAMIAAFRAVISDSFEASLLATAYFGLTGQIAAGAAKGPGSFRVLFIDNLYQANWEKMKELLS